MTKVLGRVREITDLAVVFLTQRATCVATASHGGCSVSSELWPTPVRIFIDIADVGGREWRGRERVGGLGKNSTLRAALDA